MRFVFYKDGMFRYSNPSDSQNECVIYPNQAGGLRIAVSNEQAVDSYNDVFECDIFLDKDAAIQLRDYLIKHFPL